ncbi:hypothetical protein [Spirosoma panaciterrae]|uniref:hypothetical protein n=1 Tax=Spirosoma panaciterrae TaxID=496058 RepID=UPI000360851B|nr:hypothetical protein [Spirosoma panaciterrae]
MQPNNNPLKNYLLAIDTALNSSALNLNTSEDDPWKPAFIQLIKSVHTGLTLADQAGKRVDFLDDVGVNGKIQDITSLISWMHDCLPELTAEKPGQLATNRVNRYANAGWGYFANGCFFDVQFEEELAFFIDDQRVYLNRHIRRAISELKQTASIQA